jgi:plastocyanin
MSTQVSALDYAEGDSQGFSNDTQLSYDYAHTEETVRPKKFDRPTREMAIIVTEEGYYPKSISVFEGERVHFYITSTLTEPSCFILAGKETFISANKGRLTETVVEFDEAGTHRFYCPSNKISGKVTVLGKPKPLQKLNRSLASMKGNPIGRNKKSAWRPKDY